MISARLVAYLSALWFLSSLPVLAAPLEIILGPPDGPGNIVLQPDVKTRNELLHKNVIIQQKDYSCGTASLATVLNFYLGQSVDETEIIKSLLEINKQRGTIEEVVKRRGFSLLDLKLFAESRGFKAAGYRLDFGDLATIGAPAIVPIIPSGFKHFVVFRGADKSRVYLADPSYGNLIQSIDEFKRDWYGFTNVALVVLTKEGHKPPNHPMSITDLDKVFVGEDVTDAFRYKEQPARFFLPGEF